MIGDDLIAIDGTDMIDADGNDVLDDGAGDECCCTSEIPRYVCGSTANCGKFCFPTKEDIQQSECCPCPCPGGRGLPPGYSYTISGVTLLGGRQPASTLA